MKIIVLEKLHLTRNFIFKNKYILYINKKLNQLIKYPFKEFNGIILNTTYFSDNSDIVIVLNFTFYFSSKHYIYQ